MKRKKKTPNARACALYVLLSLACVCVCARTLYIDDAMLSLTRARGILYSSLRDFFLFFFENFFPPSKEKA